MSLTTKTKDSAFTVAQKDIILKLLERIGYDGHSLYAPSVLEGFPPELIKRFNKTYKSDGSYKGSMWKGGKMIPEQQAVYGLDVLDAIVSDLEIKGVRSCMGRGFQAQSDTEGIMKFFNPAPVETVPAS